ncbi:hypothetical protein B2J88_18455 [Rhodococcus sp. SRB_17]|uniref:WXG100 family type VII secretion target n=1 Tax=Rhodococcus sp. OK302 TaxID=1882769 RepID=UPI000B9409F6|nr:hypothetical protein [Rhodococcus sp. OK302]NMM86318.1 hypothetical protein [Rhodococcus sp. SRB_17]OYD69782.1 hypothetical protein BDB13_3357 [Rhodococcus sp. OK302]
MPEFWIDVEEMRSVAPRFASISRDLEEARLKIEEVMAAEGPSWGTDTFGVTFASAYLPGSESVLAGVTMTAGALRNLTDALFRTTANFESIDARLADNLAGGL